MSNKEDKEKELLNEVKKSFEHLNKEQTLLQNIIQNSKEKDAPPYNPGDLAKEQLESLYPQTRAKNTVVQSESQGVDTEAPTFVVEGHRLPFSYSQHMNAITLLMYIFGKVLSKDKRIAKILKEANFQFADADGNQIFPKKVSRKKSPKKKKKPKNAKSRKRGV